MLSTTALLGRRIPRRCCIAAGSGVPHTVCGRPVDPERLASQRLTGRVPNCPDCHAAMSFLVDRA